MDFIMAEPEVIELSDDDDDEQQRAVVDLTLDDNEFLLPPSPDTGRRTTLNDSGSSNATPARIESPQPLVEADTPNHEFGASPMQLDDNRSDPQNSHVELSKLFTSSPEQTSTSGAAPLSKRSGGATLSEGQLSSSPQSDFEEDEAPNTKMDDDKVAERIREQIEEDHESDVANTLEESLHNCLERPLSAYLQATSFLNPTPKVQRMNAAYPDEPSRVASSFITITSHEDPVGFPRKVSTTVSDISQPELPKIPEYTRYTTIERSFHAKRPELLPNPKRPEKDAERSLEEAGAERGQYIENIRKMEEEEKARSLRPYRGRIRKAINKAEKEGTKSTSRIRAAFRKLLDIDEDGLRLLLSGLERSQIGQSSIEEVESNFMLGCLACATHHCFTHGHYDGGKPSESTSHKSIRDRKEPKLIERQLKGFTRHVEAKTRAYGAMVPSAGQTEIPYCENTCYRGEDTEDPANEISQATTNSAEAIMLAYDLDVREPCDIAAMLSLTCQEVYYYMVFAGLEIGARVLLPQRQLPKGKGNPVYWREHAHHERTQPAPCRHPGLSCSKAGKTKCSCVEQQIYCYKTCGCQASCPRLYKGCKCTGLGSHDCTRVTVSNPDAQVEKCKHPEPEPACLGCTLKKLDAEHSKCDCQKINRECDSDVCRCGVKDILEDKKDSKACRNCDIQKGGMKDMVLGTSTEAGYGLFLNEPVKFGDYLGEYVGEIITHDEEYHRRELHRNKGDPNYMFKINEDFDVDSAHFGNITRFINHSVWDLNCCGMVKLINGEHRIGFYSVKNLPAGTELFFDYGADFENELPHAYVRKGEKVKGVPKHIAQPSSKKFDRAEDGGRVEELEDEEEEDDDDDDVQMATKDDTEDEDAEEEDADEDDEYMEPRW